LKESALDLYSLDTPSHQLGFSILEGAWLSDVPGYGLGHSPLFDDHRINWLSTQDGGFSGKNILELGPLEGGHTYMMANGGAAQILAVESNSRAFLKCLLVQNALKFNAQFMYGDFRQLLAKREQKFDLVLASGVLYHMSDPVTLLEDIAHASDSVCLWTHYYHPEVAKTNEWMQRHLSATPTISEFHGREIITHRNEYLGLVDDTKFAGGSSPYSQWMTRESLLGVLADLGMTVVIGREDYDHASGASILLYATRIPEFNEQDYLARHHDVAAAVKAGHTSSGAEHYLRFGKAEGREPR
jgi:Methyltransferase domain